MKGSRERLLARRPQTSKVTIAGDVYTVIGVSAGVQDDYEWRLANGQQVNYRSFIAINCIIDPDTMKPIFKPDDEPDLMALPAEDLDAVVAAAMKIDGGDGKRDHEKKD